MLRNIPRFRLHAHNLRVETPLWQEHTSVCDKCDGGELQDEKDAVFLCSCGPMCSFRKTFEHLFSGFPSAHRVLKDEIGASYKGLQLWPTARDSG